MIGREEVKLARNTDLLGAIRIGLDECMTALEECFYDLSDEQVSVYPLAERHNIATIVMHCLMGLDNYGVACQGGTPAVEYEGRFDLWAHSSEELRAMQGTPPTVADMLEKLRALRHAVFTQLESTSPDELMRPREGIEWYEQSGRVTSDAYLRTIMHTMAHTRQVWMLRGVMGLTDRDGWPEQHWA